MTKSETIRCAVYTRKSSDEGLDQAFNSLDAQRDAGEAYIKSQASEGWKLVPTRYDDGGFSGGTMERPALRLLLADIEVGLIDVVVVYKIDRLTRSLSDFSRIVEIFEKGGTSFVSVTQSFNTTTSMGRLMLNVLLSFAQFEREVTGERIRDKIAASKAKGMWMGGTPPLGYDLPAAGTRKLQVNKAEAVTVRAIFARYLELGSVHRLQRELVDRGTFSKERVTGTGKTVGGAPFSRGALFHLLRNRIYRGQIVHGDLVHEGEHDAIVDEPLFDKAQRMLDANARRHRTTSDHRIAKAPLTGKLFDAAGEPMSPTFSRGASGKAYRYYVSASLQQGLTPGADETIRRVAAPAIELVVTDAADRWLGKDRSPLDHVLAARFAADGLMIDLCADRANNLVMRLAPGERIVHATSKIVRVFLPLALPLRGGKPRLALGQKQAARPDPALIAALRKAHRMVSRERGGLPLVDVAPISPYDRTIMRLAFLAPDLQRDILAGHQPSSLSLESLRTEAIPLSWSEQRTALGWLDRR